MPEALPGSIPVEVNFSTRYFPPNIYIIRYRFDMHFAGPSIAYLIWKKLLVLLMHIFIVNPLLFFNSI